MHAYDVIHFLKIFFENFEKLRKLNWKTWMRQNRQRENKEFEAFEIVTILLLYTFFEKSFSNRWVILLSNKTFSENFFNDVLDEKWRVMLILGIFLPRNKWIGPVKKFIMIFYLRNIFWQVLSSPTIWEYRCIGLCTTL